MMQFVSSGAFGVTLYWAEWKFGWGPDLEAAGNVVSIGSMMVGAVLGPRLFLEGGLNLRYSTFVAGMSVGAGLACVPLGLTTSSVGVIFWSFLFGAGFGNQPALYSLISAEAGPEHQGRVQGFNYCITSVSWYVSNNLLSRLFTCYI
jgi:MFS family permease